MSDTVFRSYTPPAEPEVTPSEWKANTRGADESDTVPEPLDGAEADMAVLDVLGIEDNPRNMPEEAQQQLSNISQYLLDVLKSKGKTPTVLQFGKELDALKYEMGLEDDVDPDVAIERIGGVIKAWKELSFVRSPQEKRSLFMKLARQPDTKSMNKVVFEEMSRREVWR